MEQFFSGFTPEALTGLFFTVLFGLFPGFNFFQWLKHELLVVDKQAHYMVMAISIVLTATALFLTGSLGLEGFEMSLQNILTFAGTLYAASQVAYQRFKNGPDSPAY